ncbi:MAG: DNA polymerase IV [Bacillota bacterium]|nr:DNA polymerase IV [Bacillota bacterium]
MDNYTADNTASNDRVILHCDMNGFFASVELLDHPELRDVPMAVSGDPDSRHGIILAKNEIAKSYGVVTAETIWQAKKKCPDLRTVPPHHEKYRAYSKLINAVYLEYTDQVEPFSVDESWLDVTASRKLFGTGPEIADEIRRRIREKYDLTLSVGVSFNKIFAKMGSDYKKPDATTVITRDNFRDLLWPLDIGELFFVGGATAGKLRKFGIKTIGDLALSDRRMISDLLGKHGGEIHDYANGLDTTPVLLYSQRAKAKSVGHNVTFSRNLQGREDIKKAVMSLSSEVASRLRKKHMKAFGIKVDIKDTDLKVISRQTQISTPTNLTEVIAETSLSIIDSLWNPDRPIRMLSITGINLCDENQAQQLSLFASENVRMEQGEKVERAMDDIRAKFGSGAISFAGTMHRDF